MGIPPNCPTWTLTTVLDFLNDLAMKQGIPGGGSSMLSIISENGSFTFAFSVAQPNGTTATSSSNNFPTACQQIAQAVVHYCSPPTQLGGGGGGGGG